MAIAFVTQSYAVDNTSTATTLAVPFTVAIGDCIVVAVGRGAAFATAAPTDDGGNTYTKSDAYVGASTQLAIFTTIATASATSIAANFTAGAKTAVAVAKYSGVGSIGANHGNGGASSQTVETITCTLAATTNWAVAGLAHNGNATPTQQNGTKRVTVSTIANTGVTVSINDNTGALSVVCSNTLVSSVVREVYCELVPASSGTNGSGTVVGAADTSAAGSLAGTGTASTSVVGSSASSAAGALAGRVDRSAIVVGASATAAAGVISGTVVAPVNAMVVGASCTAAAGTPSGRVDRSATVAGIAAASAAGAIAGRVDKTATIVGIQAASSAGVVSCTAAASATLLGVSCTATAGTVLAQTAGAASATVVGKSASLSAGIIAGTANAVASVPGKGAVSAVGVVSVRVSVSASVVGVAVLASAGTIDSKADARTDLLGAEALAAAGNVSALVKIVLNDYIRTQHSYSRLPVACRASYDVTQVKVFYRSGVALLQEGGSSFLMEDGSRLLMENSYRSSFTNVVNMIAVRTQQSYQQNAIAAEPGVDTLPIHVKTSYIEAF
jgi:hypothetical protein